MTKQRTSTRFKHDWDFLEKNITEIFSERPIDRERAAETVRKNHEQRRLF